MHPGSFSCHETDKDGRFLLTSKAVVAAVQPPAQAHRVFSANITDLGCLTQVTKIFSVDSIQKRTWAFAKQWLKWGGIGLIFYSKISCGPSVGEQSDLRRDWPFFLLFHLSNFFSLFNSHLEVSDEHVHLPPMTTVKSKLILDVSIPLSSNLSFQSFWSDFKGLWVRSSDILKVTGVCWRNRSKLPVLPVYEVPCE